MGYIQPNSDVVLFRNIKLDSGYENTIYFASRSAQESYFFNNSKILQHLTQYTYIRNTGNAIKVKLPMSTVLQSTYMAFKNTSYENKWFYCFIDDADYVNDNTTIIYFHIDLIQTWFIGDCTLNQCYVEREHAVDDTVGANRVPEPIGSDRIMYTLKWECDEMKEYSVIISASKKESASISDDDYYKQGLFNGIEVKDYSFTDASDAGFIMTILQDMLGDGNYIDPNTGYTDRQQVVSIIMFPSAFTQETLTGNPKPIYSSSLSKARTEISGYTPKNNKLLTAPYKSLLLTNGIGGCVTLDYDDFSDNIDVVQFKLWGVCSGHGEIICVPQWYKGVENNYDYKLMINGFPQCAYTLDAYRAWIAGGGDKYQKVGIINGIAEGVQKAFNVAWTASAMGMAVDNAKEAVNKATQAGQPFQKAVDASDNYERVVQEAKFKTARSASGIGSTVYNTGLQYMETQYEVGNLVNVPVGENSESTLVASRELNFRCYELNIIADDARRIDDFFSMYGYATKRTKVPNISSRPQWNYVKTGGCSISGNVPSTIRTSICELFDKGIRFWNNGDNIGNYSLANK